MNSIKNIIVCFFVLIISFSSYLNSVDLGKVPKGCAAVKDCNLDTTVSPGGQSYNTVLWSSATECDICGICNALSKGAQINEKDSLDRSALQLAVENCDDLEVVKLLLENGASADDSVVQEAQEKRNEALLQLLGQRPIVDISDRAAQLESGDNQSDQDRVEINRVEGGSDIGIQAPIAGESLVPPRSPFIAPVPVRVVPGVVEDIAVPAGLIVETEGDFTSIVTDMDVRQDVIERGLTPGIKKDVGS